MDSIDFLRLCRFSCLLLSMVTTVSSQVASISPSTGDSSTSNDASGPSIGLYKAHGWLLWTAFGVLYPIGILTAKYGKSSLRSWFQFHWIIQLTATLSATAGIAIALREFDALADSTHAKLGLSLGLLIWLQPLLAFVRPHKGGALRQSWYFSHWLFGTGAVILGWFNIFKGLDLYVADWPEDGTLQALYIAFSVQVAVLAFFYLLLDRWQHLMSQSQTLQIRDMGTEMLNNHSKHTEVEKHSAV